MANHPSTGAGTNEAAVPAVTDEAMHEADRRFRALANVVPGILWSTDSSGHMLWHNNTWYEYTGQSPAEAEGDGWRSALHPEDFASTCSHYKTATSGGTDLEYEGRIRGRDGAYRWFLTRAKPSHDDAGNILRWYGFTMDIHHLKGVEGALAAAEERLRLILESAHEHAIISMDLNRMVQSWNAGAERIFGYDRDEVVNQLCDFIFIEEDRASGAPVREAERAITNGRSPDNRWHVRKDGSRFWAQGVMLTMNSPGGEGPAGLLKILSDETESERIRQELKTSREEMVNALDAKEAARAEAELAGQAKDRFLAVLSHELRTPLTPVLLATSMLLRRTDLPESVADALAIIQRNIELEAHFVDDLLDVTRIERGKIELIVKPLNLHKIIQDAVEICQPDIRGKQQRLTVQMSARQHHMNGDAARLQQVFWNLLKNASKFTPVGGEVSITTADGKNEVLVSVVDSGIGMEQGSLEGIFNPFVQANKDITREYGGLGLGLAISKASVEAHGGKVEAFSEGPGKGAEFRITFPIPSSATS